MKWMKVNSKVHWLGFLMVAALAVTAGAEDVKLIDNFIGESPRDAWVTRDNANITYADGQMTLVMPKYEGGDAAWPGAWRDVSAWDFSSFNGLQFTLENPTDLTQRFDAVVYDGQNEAAYLLMSIRPHSRQTIRLRFENAYHDADWSDIRRLLIMRTQPDATYRWHLYEVALFRDAPDRVPNAVANAALSRAVEAYESAASLMDAETRKSTQQTIEMWRSKIQSSGGLRGQLTNCRAELTAIVARAGQLRAVEDAKSQSDPALLAWTVVPGRTFRPAEVMLQYHEPAQRLAIHAARGEYGDALLRLTNVGQDVQELRLAMRGPEGGALPSLSLRRNVPVLARDGTLCGDALVPLDTAASIVTLPVGETVELWVRADVRHDDWPTGAHGFTLEARDLRRPGIAMTAVPVEVNILDVDLDAANGMRVNLWPEMGHARSWIVHGREEAARDNMFDYGANVHTLIAAELPWPEFAPDGTIVSIDFTRHTEVIEFLREAGSPQILFWMEMDAHKPENWALRAGFEPGSEVWRRALSNWLTAWTDHLSELGLTTQDYAFYVADEPNREELERSLLFAEIAKSLNPELRMYVNHGGELWDDQTKNDRLLKLTDIWQPDEAHQSDNQKAMVARHPHLERWVYQCLMSRRNHGVNAHDYYRLMAWRAMRDGVSGIGYWTYSAAHPGEDPWDGTQGTASGGVLIYPDGDSGLHMSVRWELVRMALDDARYADLLRRAAPEDEAQQQAIHALLNERLLEAIAQSERPELVAQWRIEAGRLLEAINR